jgi:SH3 domain-containing YSC84-like protein 1
MATRICQKRALVTACMLALMSAGGFAAAQSTNATGSSTTQNRPSGDKAQEAQDHLQKSVKVIQQMDADPGMKKLLKQAKGVYIVPDYGRAALGVGARGGAGVLFVKQGGKWGNPAFYNMGGVSAGAQAGVEAGAIALLLNNQKALNSFKKNNNFSLNAEAGLTVVNWSAKAQGSAGKGDVVAWSDTEGAFGDLAVSVTDINFDEKETGAFYGRKIASAADVIGGKVKAPRSPALKDALAALSGSSATSTGDSAATGSGSGASGTAATPSQSSGGMRSSAESGSSTAK